MRAKRAKQSFAAVIMTAAAILLLTACLYIFSGNTDELSADNDSHQSERSSIGVSTSNSTGLMSEETEDEISHAPSGIEVILYNNAVQLTLDLDSVYAAAVNADNAIIFQKNTYERCYPASLTKLLTVSTAARYVDEDSLFTVGDEIDLVLPGSTTAYLQKGDVLNFIALTDALLLPSGNDAAYVMAVGVGRAYANNPSLPVKEALELFVSLMNQTADDIGCIGSNFTVPDGYHDENHYSTASDMLKIAVYAAKNDFLRNSVSKSKARHVFYSGRDVTWVNTNLLLNSDSSYFYSAATGMKTGTTPQAGSCLIVLAERNGREVIAVLMSASSEANRYSDAITLLDAALNMV